MPASKTNKQKIEKGPDHKRPASSVARSSVKGLRRMQVDLVNNTPRKERSKLIRSMLKRNQAKRK